MSDDTESPPLYPVEDWRYEVTNGDTNLGYDDWVKHCQERDVADPERLRQRIIVAHDKRHDFVTDTDGYIYFWPTGTGTMASHHLRWIAAELDKRNKEWDKTVRNDPALNVPPDDYMHGVRRIADERQRQVKVEGWSPEHDDGHKDGDLMAAAHCYLRHVLDGDTRDGKIPARWPWDGVYWNATSAERSLEKAGALIAAELDRRERLKGKTLAKGYLALSVDESFTRSALEQLERTAAMMGKGIDYLRVSEAHWREATAPPIGMEPKFETGVRMRPDFMWDFKFPYTIGGYEETRLYLRD